MKLSINNFKTIRELKDFKFNSINIISGVNSSGKTSFIQFLLLLKQTIEKHSASPELIFNDDLINLGGFSDLVYKKETSNSMCFELRFDTNEFGKKFDTPLYRVNSIAIGATYSLLYNNVVLNKICFKYNTTFIHNNNPKDHSIEFILNDGKYKVNADTNLFGKLMPMVDDNNNPVQLENGKLNFNSFIPLTFTNDFLIEEVKTQGILELISDVFKFISYIGPLRAEPNDSYKQNRMNKYIGKNGEYAAQFLEEEAENLVEFYSITDDGGSCQIQTKTLNEAVKYWICDVFNLAKDIRAEKNRDESYTVTVVNQYDVETTIRQVGFGISQILPIIVEGLRMPKKGLLILEQPEIHLHPKVQSMLFDFIYSMSLTGKRFLIETHSDHFITRMRRRVAESNEDLSQKINMVFVEQREAEHIFRKLDLSDMGTFKYFPNDFVEQSEDYDAIIMAQANKALKKQQ